VIPDRLQPLLAETSELSARFQRAGFRLYLVGGVVRDALLDRLGAGPDAQGDYDLDFTTDARPDDIEAIVAGWADAVWFQGKRFGTIGLRKGSRRMERAQTWARQDKSSR
jgi:poly(A) polymerase